MEKPRSVSTILVFFGLDPAPPSFRHARPPKWCLCVRLPAGLALRRRGRCSSPLYLTLFRKSSRQEKGGTFPLGVSENKRAETKGVLVRKGIIFLSVQLRLQLGKCNATLFRVKSHYRKGGTHTYNMMKTGNYLKSVMKSNIDARTC